MKNRKRLFATILLIGMIGCKKHQGPIPVGMSAIVNNKSWVATGYLAYLDTSITVNGNIVSLYIEGTDATTAVSPGQNDLILIITYFKFKTGTYYLNTIAYDTTAGVTYSYNFLGYRSISGSITLTQISANNVQGFFNCVFTPSLALRNGQFNIPLHK